LRDVPVLAIGLGFELLGDGVVLGDGTRVSGLGLVPGEARPLDERAAGDLVVSSAFGLLVGFENHARGYEIDESTPALGSVLHGVGNSSGDGGREGLMMGSVIGSHLHGPLLAQNPALADAILAKAIGDAYSPANPRARWADSLAEKARLKILSRAGVSVAAREARSDRERTEVRP
jgi:CobQ-like glutamine amidotransferase family enzyme